jgi:hypothetical protein
MEWILFCMLVALIGHFGLLIIDREPKTSTISRRDFFAANAMRSYLHQVNHQGPGVDPKYIARWAAEQADAMIEVLDNTTK